MDPIGRCSVICAFFLLLCAFFSLCAAMMSSVRVPGEDEEDKNPVRARLYEKRNIYRFRFVCSSGVCAVCLSSVSAYVIPNAVDGSKILALAITAVSASVAVSLLGIYIPYVIGERLTLTSRAYTLLSVSCKFSAVLAGIPSFLSGLLFRSISVDPEAKRLDVTEEEILKLMDDGESSGAINSEEREMIENIMDFSDRCAREVMRHYMDVCAVCEGDSDEKILNMITETGYSRYPVYKNDIGTVTGVLIAKEYLTNRLSDSPLPMAELIRPPLFIPEAMQTDTVLRKMKDAGQHMAIVVNEYGEASGIVTMEDLLEEIVGSIYDESDTPDDRDPEITKIGENTWRLHATATLEELSEKTGELLYEGDGGTDTLGALFFSCLTTIPDDGESIDVETERLVLHSEGLHERRLEWIDVTVKPDEENGK